MDDPYGRGLRPGSHHYRAYVGPPSDYDLMGGLQFTLLFAAGLRETHAVLDIGCGSLRGGRLLIPYLRPGRYYGLEPNRWLVQEGIDRELGADAIELKQPHFLYDADFSVGRFGTSFDWVLAQSIFSHTFADLATTALRNIATVLGNDGLLLATVVEGATTTGTGWLYPGCVTYAWEDFSALISRCGLVGVRLRWPHPRQTWFVAGLPPTAGRLQSLERRLDLPGFGTRNGPP